jgi:hypothetical protein
MTTAHKAKEAKGKTTWVKKNDANGHKTVCDEMAKMLAKIQSIDTSDWTVDDRAAFQAVLIALKTGIDAYLAGMPVPKS